MAIERKFQSLSSRDRLNVIFWFRPNRKLKMIVGRSRNRKIYNYVVKQWCDINSTSNLASNPCSRNNRVSNWFQANECCPSERNVYPYYGVVTYTVRNKAARALTFLWSKICPAEAWPSLGRWYWTSPAIPWCSFWKSMSLTFETRSRFDITNQCYWLRNRSLSLSRQYT